MNVAVIGPSDFTDADLVDKALRRRLKPGDFLHVKGRMKGAARMAHDWATSGPKENWRQVYVYYLDDDRREKDRAKAEEKRESEMLKVAELLVVFGAEGRMAAKAREKGIKVRSYGK